MKVCISHLLVIFLIAPIFVKANSTRDTTLSVYFKTDEYSLIKKESKRLSHFLDWMLKQKLQTVSISGSCDDIGTNTYNLSLSAKRANAVKLILLEEGIAKALLKTTGLGEIPLSNDKDSLVERRNNRRVLLNVSYSTQEKKDTESQSSNASSDFSDLAVGDKITLNNILFVGGRSWLLPESSPYLERITRQVKENEHLNFKILGHICCMPRGNDGLDHSTGRYDLSVARAKKIYDHLVQEGIDSTRLSFEGLGSNFPTGFGDKYDRRVEMEVVER